MLHLKTVDSAIELEVEREREIHERNKKIECKCVTGQKDNDTELFISIFEATIDKISTCHQLLLLSLYIHSDQKVWSWIEPFKFQFKTIDFDLKVERCAAAALRLLLSIVKVEKDGQVK